MSWNNGSLLRAFQRKQEKQAKYYASLGMTEEQIAVMRAMDVEEYNSERNYYRHTQPLDVNVFYESDCDESDNALLEKFGDRISVSLEDSNDFSRYWWIEELDTPELAKAIKALPKEEIELLTMLVFDEMTHQEIAKKLGISRQAVSKKISRIGSILGRISKNAKKY